jgi:hypothetical protein
MTTKYTLTAYCPFGLGEIEVDIVYTYTPGRPARGPSYASGGEPADPPEIEFVSAALPKDKLSDHHQLMLNEWAEEWLADEGFDDAVDNAEGA